MRKGRKCEDFFSGSHTADTDHRAVTHGSTDLFKSARLCQMFFMWSVLLIVADLSGSLISIFQCFPANVSTSQFRKIQYNRTQSNTREMHCQLDDNLLPN